MNDIRPQVGVGVFIIKDGKFVMGLRRNAHGHGTWSVPGGHLELTESWEDTAKREVKEETGLGIENIRFGGITNDVFKTEHKHYVTIWILSSWKSGKLVVVEPDKFTKLEWRTFDNLPEPLFLPWRQLLKSEFIGHIKAECANS